MNPKPRHSWNVRPVPERLTRTLLGEEPIEKIDRAGLEAIAVRATGHHPETNAVSQAVACRLLPKTDDAKILFHRAGQRAVETIVWPDEGDDLELSLLEGFHNAFIVADKIMAAARRALPN